MAVPCEMLLHPELLTNEQLIYVLHERHLRVPNLENMARDELLHIFHQYCVPHGQRRYRDSGRGKVLNKARPVSPPAPQKVSLNTAFNSRKSVYSDHFERIKPPPDLLSGHMKRIKLENKDKDAYLKRKMSIDSDTPATDSPPPKKDRKPITWP
ncbi:ashwin-like [Cydia pomonella]|uniref:ashwin-like n=1 Tax=Cydia pomonella TaxID=82600 RepID=UPI002ADDD4C2|nr:ashwin-like [Cydia pomonella]